MSFLKILGVVGFVSTYVFLWAAFMASGLWFIGIPMFVLGLSTFIWVGNQRDWWI